ncbi:tyrosine-type recombinase/integrase [Schleiferilactobacillus perolens]|uniref:tyrosine-type recombinase/integrase n=1 Tax=Schleiferilactobacillus perolens TaxID=100468 RepID=UPI002353F13B|nr:site-specific integrase [Schleiferilactobacillus perolens]MCI2170991.1 site-specific integrase [Schleiferilactobacillus perolens]
MASLKQYTTKAGKKMWKVTVYAGRDPQTGKQKYIVRGGFHGPDGKKKAALTGARLELAISKGDLAKDKPTPVLFREVYEEWYGNYVNTVRESTWARTAGMFDNHILPAFGDKRIATITTRDVQKAVKAWYEATTANYKRWYNYVVSVMDYAERQGYMSKNPAKAVVLPRHEETAGDKPENFWTKDQINRFFSCIDKTEGLDIFIMFRVLAYTGVRRGELLALEWQDVDFEHNTVRINKTLTQGNRGHQIVQAPKTRAGRRTIPVDQQTMDWLKKWRHLQQQHFLLLGINTLAPHQLVFSNRKNGHHSLNTPAKRLLKIQKDNKLTPRITVHGFRHSFISNLLIAGVPVTSVQKLVGHTDPAITLGIYAHVSAQQESEATAALARYMNA